MGAEMLEMDMDDIGISTSVSSDTGTTANMAFLDTLAGWDMDFLSADKSSSSSSSNLCHPEESVAVRTDSGSAGSTESAAAAAAMGSDGSSRLCTGDGRGWGTRQAGNHLEAYSEKLTILSCRVLHSAQGSRGILHVAKGLLDDVKSQHASLRQEIGGLQKLVELSRGL
ncbi:hypothetical protein LY76DRAFT_651866 [Colletotrichum caudatum]|nr:hypothetical protein LY76DRAFT_651866 [Colletotrichum caudatum]